MSKEPGISKILFCAWDLKIVICNLIYFFLFPFYFLLEILSFILSLKQKPDPDATSQYERRITGG